MSVKPLYKVLLVGNYRLDRQMSMLRYSDMLLRELSARGVDVEAIEPSVYFGKLNVGPVTKWLRYLDKYIIFPLILKSRVQELTQQASASGAKLIIHVTDHSNALYLTPASEQLSVVTCHDLLAVRGSLGEDTDCPASRWGKLLQTSILKKLRSARHIICVSLATRHDLTRLAPETESSVIPLPLNQPYGVLPEEEIRRRLTPGHSILLTTPYVLHVGSSLKRKNREGILRIFAKIAGQFDGMLVFAGEALQSSQRELADQLGLLSRIVEIPNPSGEIIEALYNQAYAFLFPSKTEGFGWPVIEAQACGCPVLVARTTSLPEVVGDGGLIRDFSDETGFAEDLLSLSDNKIRHDLVELGRSNLARFATNGIIQSYLACYQTLASNS